MGVPYAASTLIRAERRDRGFWRITSATSVLAVRTPGGDFVWKACDTYTASSKRTV